MKKSSETVESPLVVVVDNNENLPYSFLGLRTDASSRRRLLTIRVVRRSLETGDYTIEGLEKFVAIERKSLNDLYQTLGHGRDRFERELQRMQRMSYAAVVVESSWTEILNKPPSRLLPKSVFRSVLAWSQRFPKVHWFMMDHRRLAEITTFRILERFYKERLAGDLDFLDNGGTQTTQQ